MHRLLLVLAVAVAGCGPMTRTFDVSRPDDLAALHRQTSRAPTTVVLLGGFRHPAEALAVRDDSLSWLDPRTRELRTAALSELSAVAVSARPRVTGEGLIAGTVLGGVVGAFNAKDRPESRGFDPFQVSRGAGTTLLTAAFAGLGAAVGAFWGADTQVEDLLLLTMPESSEEGGDAAPPAD